MKIENFKKCAFSLAESLVVLTLVPSKILYMKSCKIQALKSRIIASSSPSEVSHCVRVQASLTVAVIYLFEFTPNLLTDGDHLLE